MAMNLGTARTPTAILEARGAFKKHPERKHHNEPNTGRGVGPPPEHLSNTEKLIWNETVAKCAPGVFQSSDADALEIYCMVMAELRPHRGPTRRATTPQSSALKIDVLLKFWARFGMTPGDRSRVSVTPGTATPNGDGKPLSGLAKFTTPKKVE